MQKTIMVHVDGMTGISYEELGGATPLQVAKTPHLDSIASHGEHGRLGVPGEQRAFLGEMALLTLLGYDPRKYYTGPGPFEAVSLEVVLDKHDVAYLCHLVTLRASDGWGNGKKLGSQLIMDDVCAGGVDTEEARELLDAINDQLVSENIQLYFGHHHRHLMVWVGGGGKIVCRNPQEAIGQSIGSYLPSGDGSEVLHQFMEASRVILNGHPVNQERVETGQKPANCLWLWGSGKPVDLQNFCEKWGAKGTVVSPDSPYLGVGASVGLRALTIDDDGKGEISWLQTLAHTASTIMEKEDVVCVHIPASSSALGLGQPRSPAMAVECLQNIDEHLIGGVHTSLASKDSCRMIIVFTPPSPNIEKDVSGTALYVVSEGSTVVGASSPKSFDESEAADCPLRDARQLFERLAVKQ